VPFGRWLLAQPAEEVLTPLTEAAKRYPKVPKDGNPDDLRARLNACGAEGEMFEVVDDAELDWSSC